MQGMLNIEQRSACQEAMAVVHVLPLMILF